MNAYKITVILFALLLMPPAYSADLFCNGNAKVPPLTLQMDRLSVPFTEFSFHVTPFLPESLACQRWMDSILKKQEYRQRGPGDLAFSHLLNIAHHVPQKRSAGNLTPFLYSECERSPFCHLEWPYRAVPWVKRVFDTREIQKPILFSDDKAYCRDPREPNPPLPELLPQDLGPDPWVKAENTEIWLTPLDSFARRVFDVLKKKPKGVYLLSTLTYSVTQMQELFSLLKQSPETEVYFFFDLSSTLIEREFEGGLTPLPPNLHLVPVFNTPTQTRFFHLKGLTSAVGEPITIFASVNFKSPKISLLLDYGFQVKSREIAQVTAREMLKVLDRSCEEARYLECSLEARFSPNDSRKTMIRKLLKDSCSRYAANPELKKLSKAEHATRSVMTTSEVDVLKFTIQLINEAKLSVYGNTHHVDHPDVLKALAAARKRGVKVRIFVGSKDSKSLHRPEEDEQPVLQYNQNQWFETHTKAIVIDEKKLLFGTGNLTKNGLEESDELFFYTEDKKMVRSMELFLESASQLYDPPKAVLKFHRIDESFSEVLPILYRAGAKGLPREELRPLFDAVRDDLWVPRGKLLACVRERSAAWVITGAILDECAKAIKSK